MPGPSRDAWEVAGVAAFASCNCEAVATDLELRLIRIRSMMYVCRYMMDHMLCYGMGGYDTHTHDDGAYNGIAYDEVAASPVRSPGSTAHPMPYSASSRSQYCDW